MAAHRAPEAHDPGPSPSRAEAAGWLDQHGDVLYRYARVRVGRREIAEDLVQDTFVAALQARGRYAGDSSVRTWLMGILKHKIIDHYRRLAASAPAEPTSVDGRDPVRDEFVTSSGVWKRAPASWKTPDRDLEGARVPRGALRRHHCLGRLARALASVFFLRELEGLEMEELRRGLDLSEGNIRVRLHRARLLLRECLELPMVLREAGMSRPIGLRHILTLHCDDASELASRELDEPLRRLESLALRGHLLVCASCREFRRQIRWISEAARRREVPAGDDEGTLSDDARRRIAHALDEADGDSL